MKSLFRKPISLLLFGFVAGASSLYLYQKYILADSRQGVVTPFGNMDPIFDQFYNESIFNPSFDPFESMRQMRERMEKQFEEPYSGGNVFDAWFKKRFGGGTAEEITKKEDKDFIYYELKINGIDQEKVTVNVEGGQVNIHGETETKNESNGLNSFSRSTFSRSFPTPTNVDPVKVQIEQEKNKIIIKFPKNI